MNAIRIRAHFAAAACACLLTSFALAQTPAKAPAKAPVAAGPWAKVPAFPTGCFEYVDDNQQDPFYAKLEAAETGIRSDIDRQVEINEKIAEEFRNIDPMEQAQRMQQWMMSNPQEAMAFVQAAQNAPTAGQADQQAFEQQESANAAEWNALKASYDAARLKAYAPIEVRRKALAGRLGFAYSTAPKDLVEPFMNFFPDTGTSQADWAEGESISGALDSAYKGLCPQWWGANGKFQAFLKKQKDWYATKRAPYLAQDDKARLQQYAIMNTPAATYRSTAPEKAALEYLDLVEKVFNERDTSSRCIRPNNCDGAYP